MTSRNSSFPTTDEAARKANRRRGDGAERRTLRANKSTVLVAAITATCTIVCLIALLQYEPRNEFPPSDRPVVPIRTEVVYAVPSPLADAGKPIESRGFDRGGPKYCHLYDVIDGCPLVSAEMRDESGALIARIVDARPAPVSSDGGTVFVAAEGYRPITFTYDGGEVAVPLAGAETLRIRVQDLAGNPVDGAVVATFPRGPDLPHAIGETGVAGTGVFECAFGRARDLRLRISADGMAVDTDLSVEKSWADVRIVIPRKPRARLVCELPEAIETQSPNALRFEPPPFTFRVRVAEAKVERFSAPCPEGRCEFDVRAADGDEIVAVVELSGGGEAEARGVVRDATSTLRFDGVRRRRFLLRLDDAPVLEGRPYVVCAPQFAFKGIASSGGWISLLSGPTYPADVYVHSAGRSARIDWNQNSIDLGKSAARLTVARGESLTETYTVLRAPDMLAMTSRPMEGGQKIELWLPPGRYLVRRGGHRSPVVADVVLSFGDDVMVSDEPGDPGAIVGVAVPQSAGDELELVRTDISSSFTVQRRVIARTEPFEFRRVPAGDYTLKLGRPTSPALVRPFRVGPGETVDVGRLGDGVRKLRLRFVAPGTGTPSAGLQITVSTHAGGIRADSEVLRTDELGFAELPVDRHADWVEVACAIGSSERSMYFVDPRTLSDEEPTELRHPPAAGSVPVDMHASWSACGLVMLFVPTTYGFAGATVVRASNGKRFAPVPLASAAIVLANRPVDGRLVRMIGSAVGDDGGMFLLPWERFDLRGQLAEAGAADAEWLTLESIGGIRFPAQGPPILFRLPLGARDMGRDVSFPPDSVGSVSSGTLRLKAVRSGRLPPRFELK